MTFVYITHDQGEALTMSDRIAVMRAGVIEQVDASDRIYSDPATPFVATFVGESNAFAGRVSAATTDGYAVLDTPQGPLRGRNRDRLRVGERGVLFVRPERMALADGAAALDNAFAARFVRRDLEGAFVHVLFERDGAEFTVHLTNIEAAGHDLAGERTIGFGADGAIVLRAAAGDEGADGA